jgi:hypothetical protein
MDEEREKAYQLQEYMLRTATKPLELGTWQPDQKEMRNVVFFSAKKSFLEMSRICTQRH